MKTELLKILTAIWEGAEMGWIVGGPQIECNQCGAKADAANPASMKHDDGCLQGLLDEAMGMVRAIRDDDLLDKLGRLPKGKYVLRKKFDDEDSFDVGPIAEELAHTLPIGECLVVLSTLALPKTPTPTPP